MLLLAHQQGHKATPYAAPIERSRAIYSVARSMRAFLIMALGVFR